MISSWVTWGLFFYFLIDFKDFWVRYSTIILNSELKNVCLVKIIALLVC